MDNENENMVFEVLIEIPKGSRNKYEFDKKRRLIKLDRMLFSSVHYPSDYGYFPETLALDTIHAVGQGGHYLGQKHTRKYMRDSLRRGVSHQLTPDGRYRDPHEYAIERTKWILENHQPEPLEPAKLAELDRIMAAADKEIGG